METKNKFLLGGVGLLLIVAIAGGIYFRSGSFEVEDTTQETIEGFKLFAQPPANNPKFNNSQRPNVSYEFGYGNHRIDIGDPANDSSFTFYVWDDTYFKVNFPPELDNLVTVDENGTLVLEFQDYSARFFMIDNYTLEFEALLLSRPGGNTNSFTFPVEIQGLNCWKQLPLDEEHNDYEMCNATDCWNTTDGFEHRPLDVVNSYACYHDSKWGNEYLTGKAFHIYSIYAEDANGDSIYGDMDISNGEWTLTLDRNWLRNAEYPVSIDPTIGQTAIGGSDKTLSNRARGSNFTAPSEDGNVDLMAAYHTEVLGVGIYIALGENPGDLIEEIPGIDDNGGTPAWETYPSANSSTISADQEFLLMGIDMGQAPQMRRDASTNQGRYWPDAWPFDVEAEATVTNYIYTIYANYSSGEPPADCWGVDGEVIYVPNTCTYYIDDEVYTG